MRLPEGNSVKLPAHTDNMRRKNGYKDSLPAQKKSQNMMQLSRQVYVIDKTNSKYDLQILTQAFEALRDKKSLEL